MPKQLSPLAISNAILDAARELGITVTPLQLQKLLFFVCGWNMEMFGEDEELISDRFKAWRYGPVIPSVYREFKKFGASEITEPARNPFTNEPWSYDLEASKFNTLKEVVSIYGKYDGTTLSQLTHQDNGAWHRTWNNGLGQDSDIEPAYILEEFRRIRADAES